MNAETNGSRSHHNQDGGASESDLGIRSPGRWLTLSTWIILTCSTLPGLLVYAQQALKGVVITGRFCLDQCIPLYFRARIWNTTLQWHQTRGFQLSRLV